MYFPMVQGGMGAPAGQAWVSYYYAGSQRVAERVQSNQQGIVSALYYFLTDHLGSTTLTLDASGAVYSELRYKAWGEAPNPVGVTPTTFKYTGQREAEAGLYDYKARFYDPYLNRWIQPDTIIPDPYNPLDWDRYAYVRNSPINYTDPSGHCIQLDEGFCLHEDIPGRHFHLVDGSGLFENYIETAIADAIISGDPQSLNRIPKNTPGFMVGAAMENACEGLGYDCGSYFRETFWIAAAGILGIAGSQYPGPSTRTLSGSISQDILGDPDCVGCGYTDPFVKKYENKWYNGTFKTAADSLQYHFRTHQGPWKTYSEYIHAANKFYETNIDLAKPHLLQTGEMGIKITTKEYFGIYTNNGVPVTFGVK